MAMRRRRSVLMIFISILVVFTLITSFCFIRLLGGTKGEVPTYTNKLHRYILDELSDVESKVQGRHEFNDSFWDNFLRNTKIVDYNLKPELLWGKVRSWVSKTQLYDPRSSDLGSALNALKSGKIIKADIDSRGSQLKLLLTLEGHQRAVFKPKWYPIDKVIDGPVYAGKDRYGSEILAFYLSAILRKPLTPLTTERNISLSRDIIPVATKRLLSTILRNNSVLCVYGKCYYCKREDPVCEDQNNSLSGAILLNIDATFVTNRSPWGRTYKKGKAAAWETTDDYCQLIKPKLSTHTLLELVDVAIFDFLIQNGDRHHYETLDGNIVLLDNGKGLGNYHTHHLDILAPLYQCCILRHTTWTRLQQLSGGLLRRLLESIPNVWNFVAKPHIDAMEQRLNIIYAAVQFCRKRSKSMP